MKLLSLLIAKLGAMSIIPKVAIASGLIVGVTGISSLATYNTYTYQEKQPITYNTKSIDDDTKLVGEQEVITAGEAGVRVNTYEIKKADGIQISKKLLKEVVEKPPVEQVRKVGIVVRTETQEDEAIPFGSQTQNDANMLVGQSKVIQNGINGKKIKTYEVLTLRGEAKSKTLIKEAVAVQPVPTITAIGTGVVRYRVGAVCYDGWQSSATGSGACSHHGGVAHWLYNN